MLLLVFDRKRFNGMFAASVFTGNWRYLLVTLMDANIVFLPDGAYGMCRAARLVKRMFKFS